jgi:hypothetical protein
MIVVTSRSLETHISDKSTRPLGVFSEMNDVQESRLADMVSESLPGWARDSVRIEMRQVSANQWLSICHDDGACMHVSMLDITSVLHYV